MEISYSPRATSIGCFRFAPRIASRADHGGGEVPGATSAAAHDTIIGNLNGGVVGRGAKNAVTTEAQGPGQRLALAVSGKPGAFVSLDDVLGFMAKSLR